MRSIYPLDKKGGIKDIVLSILSGEYPLSAREIYKLVKKQKSISYQAVYKILNQLEKDKTLKKHNLGYSISNEWINYLDKFLNKIKWNYSSQQGNINKILNGIKKDGDILMITANSLSESRDYQKIIKKQICDKYKEIDISKRPTTLSLKSHFGSTIFETKSILKDEDHLLIIFPHYSIVKNKTFLDLWAKKITTNNPIAKKYKKIKIGIDYGIDYDLKIYDDITIEIHYPKNLIKKLDETYNKVRSFDEFNFFKAFDDIYMKEYSIKMIFYKDKQLADKNKEEIILRYFKE